MKLSLEEAQDKRKLGRTISLIKAQIEYILWLLSNTTTGGSTTTEEPQAFYTAASKTLLNGYTGVVDYAHGRVTAGVDQGVAYIRNADNDGWDAINRLE